VVGQIDVGPVPDGEPPRAVDTLGRWARDVDAATARARDAAAARLQGFLEGFDFEGLRADAAGAGLWTGAVGAGHAHAGFGLADLDDLFRALALDPHRLVLSREGAPIDIAAVAGERRVRPGAPTMVNPARLVGVLGEGVTAQLAHVDELHEPTGALCADLERVFGGRAKADLFCSHGRVSGLGPHFDNPELIVVQVHGSKLWRFHRPDTEHPQRGLLDEHRALEEGRRHPAGEVVLTPGEAFFLPQGWWHEAVAEGGPSAHVTFGITRPTANEAVERLVRWGRWTDAGLRAPVDEAWGPADLDAVLARLQHADGAEQWRRWSRGTMPPRAHNRLSLLWALRDGQGTERAEARSAAPGGLVPVDEAGDRLVLWTGGRRLAVPAAALPAVLAAAEGEWFTVAAVEGGWALVSALLTEGLVDVRVPGATG